MRERDGEEQGVRGAETLAEASSSSATRERELAVSSFARANIRSRSKLGCETVYVAEVQKRERERKLCVRRARKEGGTTRWCKARGGSSRRMYRVRVTKRKCTKV